MSQNQSQFSSQLSYILPNNFQRFELVANNSSVKLAVALALFLHVALFLSFFITSTPKLLKQTIAVSLVAKSSIAQNSKIQNIVKNSLSDNYQAHDIALKNTQKISTGNVSQNSLNQNSFTTKAIFDAEELNNPSPIYPELARSRGVEGKVILKVIVNEKGLVDDIAIFNSSGSSMLDLSALETVKNWHFIPAKSNNKFIRSQIMVPIVFKII
jgi:TonB family protein